MQNRMLISRADRAGGRTQIAPICALQLTSSDKPLPPRRMAAVGARSWQLSAHMPDCAEYMPRLHSAARSPLAGEFR